MLSAKSVIAVLLLGQLLGPAGCRATAAPEPGDARNEVLFVIPVGECAGCVGYEGFGQEGAQTWGPTALAAARDHTFYVVDGAHRRLLRYDEAGSLLSSIEGSLRNARRSTCFR